MVLMHSWSIEQSIGDVITFPSAPLLMNAFCAVATPWRDFAGWAAAFLPRSRESFLGVISIRHASSVKLKLSEMTPPMGTPSGRESSISARKLGLGAPRPRHSKISRYWERLVSGNGPFAIFITEMITHAATTEEMPI